MPTYIRVRDPQTRHHFDVPESSLLLRRGLVEPIDANRYPPSPVARRPKYHIKITPAGRSASREATAPTGAVVKATTSKES